MLWMYWFLNLIILSLLSFLILSILEHCHHYIMPIKPIKLLLKPKTMIQLISKTKLKINRKSNKINNQTFNIVNIVKLMFKTEIIIVFILEDVFKNLIINISSLISYFHIFCPWLDLCVCIIIKTSYYFVGLLMKNWYSIFYI